ncbi:MAG: phospholipase [Chitinophagaceae bacterium]|nr:MAG: phospholipase [Chitinophagaceae bacterium]
MHKELIIEAGNKNNPAKALIMLHGRGANAEDILSLAAYLTVKDYALYAPQATHNTWYPYSFMIEPAENEPWLSSALELVGKTVKKISGRGIYRDHIYFLGFSQGACLTLEYVARHAEKYGGIVAFTGGLIGDKIYAENYKGDFADTPVFIGTSEPDFHVPVGRVNETTDVLKSMGASVTEKIYENMGHTIIQDEIDMANNIIFI